MVSINGLPISASTNPALISVLNDGVNGNDVRFMKDFPYMGLAQSGQNHIHKNSSVRLTVPMK